MTDYVVKPLDTKTWDAFARLVERHNGVFGGCWCTWFHTFHAEKTFTAEGNRALKERLVSVGRAHAELVFDVDEAVAWCQYGSPEELPNIHHRKEYEAALDSPPDYRITCIFVDKRYRRKGVTAVALRGAVDLIAQAGGGLVEGTRMTPAARGCPSSTTPHGRSTSGRASATSAPKARGTALCAGSCPERAGRAGGTDPRVGSVPGVPSALRLPEPEGRPERREEAEREEEAGEVELAPHG